MGAGTASFSDVESLSAHPVLTVTEGERRQKNTDDAVTLYETKNPSD